MPSWTVITLGSEKVVSVCIQASSLEKVIWLWIDSLLEVNQLLDIYIYFCRCELLNWAKWQSCRKAACSANLEEQEQTSYLYNCVFRAQIYIFSPSFCCISNNDLKNLTRTFSALRSVHFSSMFHVLTQDSDHDTSFPSTRSFWFIMDKTVLTSWPSGKPGSCRKIPGSHRSGSTMPVQICYARVFVQTMVFMDVSDCFADRLGHQ